MAKSINLLLLHGNEYGPKTGVIGNWAGRAVYSPVEEAAEVLKREEFDNPGVYILKSDPQNSDFPDRVYIGESGALRSRLRSHISRLSKRPFNDFVAFTSSDSLLNKATVKYLEHKLVALAHDSKRSEVANKAASREPSISEADRYIMDGFLSEMKLILPVFGYHFLVPAVISIPETPIIHEPKDLFKIIGKTCEAFMYVFEGKFVVTKGSQVNKNTSKSIAKGWLKKRQLLLSQGIMIDEGSHYVISQDAVFDSPSAASSVVLGRQTTGPQSWINMDSGQTYAEQIANQ